MSDEREAYGQPSAAGGSREELRLPPTLLHALYAATLRADPSREIMQLTAPLFGSRLAFFFCVDRVHPRDSLSEAIGLDPQHLDALYKRDLEHDYIYKAALGLAPGETFLSTELLPREMLLNNPLYKTINKPAGFEYVLGAVVENNSTFFTDCAFARADRDFSPAERGLLTALVPHLQTALTLVRRVQAGAAGRAETLRRFDRARQPLVVLDRSGYALYANEPARRLLDGADGMTLKFNRFLFGDMTTQVEFERAVRESVAKHETGEVPTTQKIRVSRAGRGLPYAMDVVPVYRADTRALMPEGTGCIVLIYDADNRNALPIDRLAWLYRLTTAEARVCEALYGEGSVEAASRKLSLTQHTIRSHLRSIFSKLEVATQAQLMQRLTDFVYLSDVIGGDDGPAAGAGF